MQHALICLPTLTGSDWNFKSTTNYYSIYLPPHAIEFSTPSGHVHAFPFPPFSLFQARPLLVTQRPHATPYLIIKPCRHPSPTSSPSFIFQSFFLPPFLPPSSSSSAFILLSFYPRLRHRLLTRWAIDDTARLMLQCKCNKYSL